jgi:hypothetical protein
VAGLWPGSPPTVCQGPAGQGGGGVNVSSPVAKVATASLECQVSGLARKGE